MALTIPRNYAANTTLTEAQLDAAFDAVEAKFSATLISGDEIQDSTITADELASGAVTTVKIADLAVNTAKLAADAVTTAKILDANVTVAKLATDAVTTAKILDANVTTAKLADAAVTSAKVATSVYQVSSSCGGAFSTTSTSYVDVTNLSVTVTTTGRPVLLSLVADGTTGGGAITINGANVGCLLKILRDSTDVSIQFFSNNESSHSRGFPASMIQHIDVPAAGTYTYKVQAKSDGSAGFAVLNAKLVAWSPNA